MNICIAGWYFHRPLFDVLERTCHRWFVVSHREYQGKNGNGVTIPNIGLEFGCYQWYLQNQWEEGNTLFTHDDNEISEEALWLIRGIGYDQCFLFNSDEDCEWNNRIHGRAFFCSDRFLRKLREDGGFWYDDENRGNNGITAALGNNVHNLAIIRFGKYLRNLPSDQWTVAKTMVVPGLNCGYRGRISCPVM